MARHTKTKFAALAFTLMAAVGLVAAGPMTTANAGHAPTLRLDKCC